MKQKSTSSKNRYSFEEMRKFIYSFAEAIVPDGKPIFGVDTTQTKNRYFFRVKTPDNKVFSLIFSKWHNDIGTFGAIDKLFKESNPKIMLRPQIVSIEELVYGFNIDIKKLVEAIFKKFQKAVSDGIKSNYGASNKMHFSLLLDYGSSIQCGYKDLCVKDIEEYEKHEYKTPDVSSIDELMIWADLKTGVNG